MSELLLAFGLLATFSSVGLVALAAQRSAFERRRTVGLLEAQAGRITNLRQQELSRGFIDRALVPMLSGLRALGLRITPVGMRRRIAHKLVLAGSPPQWDAARVGAAKVVGGIALAAWGAFLAWRIHGSGINLPVIVGVFGVIGFLGPDAILSGKIRARQDRIRLALADTIDLLNISVEAGLGFDAALAQSVRNIPGPLSQEVSRMLQEIQLGVSRATAFRNLAERTDVEELNAFVLSMVQADVFGVSVSNVLRAQAKELRTKRRQRAEHQAMQVPVKILFPLVLCIMPSLFVVVLGPGAIRIFHGLFR